MLILPYIFVHLLRRLADFLNVRWITSYEFLYIFLNC